MADDDNDEVCVAAGAICVICTFPISILVFLITLFSLSLVLHDPKLYVQDLYIPALNGNGNGNATAVNTFIFIDLKLRNAMRYNGLRYGGLNLTFFYGGNRSFPVATYAVPGFYQGIHKTAHKTAVVRTRGLPWEDAFDRVSRGLTVDIAVEVAGTVKLRRCGVYTKRKPLVVAAVVSLDGSGEEVDQKAVRLIALD